MRRFARESLIIKSYFSRHDKDQRRVFETCMVEITSPVECAETSFAPKGINEQLEHSSQYCSICLINMIGTMLEAVNLKWVKEATSLS